MGEEMEKKIEKLKLVIEKKKSLVVKAMRDDAKYFIQFLDELSELLWKYQKKVNKFLLIASLEIMKLNVFEFGRRDFEEEVVRKLFEVYKKSEEKERAKKEVSPYG